MNTHDLILLNPNRVPGQNSLMLGNDEVGAFLNGYLALWHPAAAKGASAPPRIASPYDHEQPGAGFIFAVPDSPPLYQPEDWEQRVEMAGALSFRTSLDRPLTLDNLKEALRACGETAPAPGLIDLPPDKVAPFFAIGFGYLHLEALCEAMEHQNTLNAGDLWIDVQQAITGLEEIAPPETWLRSLQAAAERLQSAREALSSSAIHVLDFYLLDEGHLAEPWPASFTLEMPCNLIACASLLEKLAQKEPERLALIRQRVQASQVEVCGGPYVEREEALLPFESQLWNLLKGLAVNRDLLGEEIQVFGRKRFGFYPKLPQVLQAVGLSRALLLAFDDGILPSYRSSVISWPSADGKQVEAFTRVPYATNNPQTFFHLAHYLYKSITQDHAGTLALLHGAEPACLWYGDLVELTRLAPVFGQWTTISRYLSTVMAGEYASAAEPDDLHDDSLSQRVNGHSPVPVTGFSHYLRQRRRLDTAWTLAALLRSLGGQSESGDSRLAAIEDRLETAGTNAPGPVTKTASSGGGQDILEENAPETALSQIEKEIAETLATRLLGRATAEEPGFLVLNPCSFARRVALELEGVSGPLPIVGPIKAGQFSEGLGRLVVEVPPLGFAWFPRTCPPGTPPPASRMRLADQRHVRNEFFEAEIDLDTGGLRGLRDQRSHVNRIGQQLVYNPGSTMRARRVEVTSTGPALGEIISEGILVDDQEHELATFQQRFRAWLGRPILDLRLEINPLTPPEGYPWHAYFAARFAWGDERATLLRGVHGTSHVTTYTRPESPDFLELRLGRQSTLIFPQGLPFHQRHASRMVDVILIPPEETARTFDLALGLDRDYPMQTALGLVTPVPLVAVAKGPPHVGATGWLFHLDMPNLLLSSMRPAPAGADGILVRLQECGLRHTFTEFRCVRNPVRAQLLDGRGNSTMDLSTNGDAVLFDVGQSDLVQLRVDFS